MRTQSSNSEMFGSTLLYGVVIVLLAAVVSAMIGFTGPQGSATRAANAPAQVAQMTKSAHSALS